MITVGAVAVAIVAAPADAAPDPRARCDKVRLTKVGAAAAGFLGCYSDAAKDGVPVPPRCSAELSDALRHVHGGFAVNDCTWTGNDDQYFLPLLATIQGFADTALATLLQSPAPSRCGAKKLRSLGKRTQKLIKAYANSVGGRGYSKFVAGAAQLEEVVAEDFGKAENRRSADCQTTGDSTALAALAQSYLGRLLSIESRCESLPPAEFSQLAFGSWADALNYAQDQGYSLDGPGTICPGRALQLLGAPLRAVAAPLLHASTGRRASLMLGPVEGQAFVMQPETDGGVSLLGPSGTIRVGPDGMVIPAAASSGLGTGAPEADCTAWFAECVEEARQHFLVHEALFLPMHVIPIILHHPGLASLAIVHFLAAQALFIEEVALCRLLPPPCTLQGGDPLCASGHCGGFASCVPDEVTNQGAVCGDTACIAGLAQAPVVAEARCADGSCRYGMVEDCSQSPVPMHCEDPPGACVPGPAPTPVPSDCTRAQTVVGLAPASIASISVGRFHSCALTTSGEVKCWGRNGGRLGDGTITNSNVPVTALSGGAIKVAAGGGHTCALMSTGAVKCWGAANNNGQLGDGTLVGSTVPVDVAGLSGVIDIAAGNHHSCAITSSHELRCWGGDEANQLDGACDTNAGACGTQCCLPGPGIGGFTDVLGVTLGRGFSCVRRGTGLPVTNPGVWCWGSNNRGSLGRGNNLTGCSIGLCPPAPVCSDPLCSVPLFGPRGLASGGWDHTCAVEFDNELSCWGLNSSGQIGDGSTADAPWAIAGTGIKLFGSGDLSGHLALGQSHTCALTPFDVACWGDNTFGQLGNGVLGIGTGSTTPVAVSALLPLPIPSTISSGGGQHTCAMRGPLVECWGDNTDGQLGNGRFGCGP